MCKFWGCFVWLGIYVTSQHQKNPKKITQLINPNLNPTILTLAKNDSNKVRANLINIILPPGFPNRYGRFKSFSPFDSHSPIRPINSLINHISLLPISLAVILIRASVLLLTQLILLLILPII